MVQLSKLVAEAAVALALWTTGAASASVCGPRDTLIPIMEKQLKVEVHGMGTTSNGNGMVELFVGPEPKKAWFVLVTDVNKLSCIILLGEGWQSSGLEGAKNAKY